MNATLPGARPLNDGPEPISRNRFPPGDAIAWSRPGDFVLVSGTSWRSWVISGYQRLRARRPEERPSACWNHAALVVRADGSIVEAGTAGVVFQHLEKYRDEDYHYVAIPATPEQRRRAVRFAVSCVGAQYPNLAIADIAVSMITRGRLRLPVPRYDLCGSLVAGALTCAGERFDMPPRDMMPADLAVHYGVAPGS